MIVAPTPQYAVLGSSIELQCTIEVDGLTIRDTWAVGDSNFDTGLNNLSPVEMEHEGPYTCRLIDVNEEMEDVERVIEFRVTGELITNLSPAIDTPVTLSPFVFPSLSPSLSLPLSLSPSLSLPLSLSSSSSDNCGTRFPLLIHW